MKQYETYEQARIDNPKSEICKLICEGFTTESEIARGNFGQYSFTYCKASDYCEMTLQEFLERGHLLVNGDVIITCLDNVAVMGVNDFEIANFNLNHESDSKTYILRAAALENQMNIDNLATQTPEEKEALDLTDTTSHQYEMSKFSGEPRTKVEWVPVKFEETIGMFGDEIEIESDLFFQWSESNVVHVSEISGKDLIMNRHKLVRRIETPMTEREAFIGVYGKVRNEFANQSAIVDFCEFMYNSGQFKLVEQSK